MIFDLRLFFNEFIIFLGCEEFGGIFRNNKVDKCEFV